MLHIILIRYQDRYSRRRMTYRDVGIHPDDRRKWSVIVSGVVRREVTDQRQAERHDQVG